MSTATALLPPIDRAPRPVRFPATRTWLSLDLDGLAETLAGRHRLPAGIPHLAGTDRERETAARTAEAPPPMAGPRLERVPEEAFVCIRRQVAPATAAPATAAPDPATPASEGVISFFRRPSRGAGPAVRLGLPRRHKLMLAAAAAVMAFGFLQAGVERLHHDARATTVATG